MKNALRILQLIWIIFIIFVLHGCRTAQKDVFTRRALDQRIASDSTLQSEEIIVDILKDILNEFKKIKFQYPQLLEVDRVRIGHYIDGDTAVGYLKYSKGVGVAAEYPMKKIPFAKHGCIIDLVIKYPAKERAPEDKQLVQPLKLQNGKLLDIWNNVQAEHSPSGNAFVKAAYEIINSRLILLKNRLQKEP